MTTLADAKTWLTGRIFGDTPAAAAYLDKLFNQHVDSLVASAQMFSELGTPAEIRAACLAWIEDEEEVGHAACSLVACRDPLHPGPCKGWKHTLHKVAPGVFHAMEQARVEKANKKRIAKIEELKAKGLPIPKKLLVPVTYSVPTAPPAHKIGQQAEIVGGEAHAASQAIHEAAGLGHKTAKVAPQSTKTAGTGEPGKVTLGKAVKLPTSKGPAPAKTGGPAAKAYPVPGKREPKLPEPVRPQPAKTGGPAAKAQPTPGHRTPLKTVGLAKTGGPAAKAQPTPGYREPVKPGPTMDQLDQHDKLTKAEFDALPAAQKTAIRDDLTQAIAKKGTEEAGYAKAIKAKFAGAGSPKLGDVTATKLAYESTLGKHEVSEFHGYDPIQTAAVNAALGHGNASVSIELARIDALTPQQHAALSDTHRKAIADFLDAKAAHATSKFDRAKAKEIGVKFGTPVKPTGAPKVSDSLNPQGKKTGTLTDQVLNPHKYYDMKQSAALEALHGGTVEQKLSSYPMSATQFQGMSYEHRTAILADLQKIADTHDKPHEAAKAQLLHDAYTGEAKDLPKTHLRAVAIASGSIKAATPAAESEALNQLSAADIQQLKPAYRNAIAANYGQLLMSNPFDKNTEELGNKLASGVEGVPKPVVPEVPHTPTEPTVEKAKLAEVAKTLEHPAHVMDAIAMAKGQAPGASWSKNQLPVYEKLSAEEHAALQPLIKDKIISDLQKALTKFKDPKKIAATQALLEKFGHGEKKATPEVPVIHEPVSLTTHAGNHNVTKQQAADALKNATKGDIHAVVVQTLGIKPESLPGVQNHTTETAVHAMTKGDSAVDALTKGLPDAVKNHPDVKEAIAQYRHAEQNQHFALRMAQDKNAAFNAVSHELTKSFAAEAAGKPGLTPIQKAALIHYRDAILPNLPHDTSSHHLSDLQVAANQKLTAAQSVIYKVKKTTTYGGVPNAKLGELTAAQKVATMHPSEVAQHVADVLGPGAVKPTGLTGPEVQEAHLAAQKTAMEKVSGLPHAVMADPKVSAAYTQYQTRMKALNVAQEQQNKLDEHLAAYHQPALVTGYGHENKALTNFDLAAVAKHAENLRAQHAGLSGEINDKLTLLSKAETHLNQAIDEAHAAGQAAEQGAKSPLTEDERKVIGEAYQRGWKSAARDAIWYGTKSSWSKQNQLKMHADFPQLNEDFKALGEQAHALALAHAEARHAELNVPTVGETGKMLTAGPEFKAWHDALTTAKDAQAAFNAKLAEAQARMDKIRSDVGLAKRSLPKFEAAAVKTKAAEHAFYQMNGYGKPLYGKPESAKQYLVAKLGDKLAVPHKDYADKIGAKEAKKQAQAAKLAEKHAEFYAAQQASKAANQGKYALPAHLAGQESPNQAVAEHFGFELVPNTGSTANADHWTPGSSPAYVTSHDEYQRTQEILNHPDTKFGIEAQNQFKWSINNMEGNGAPSSQKKALYSYTGSGYESANSKLNSLPPGAPTGSSTIGSIDAAMKASPLPEGTTVLYRGFKNPKGVFSKSGKWNDVNVAGMEWSQRSYSSTSGSLSTAEGFAGGNHGVVMRIIIPPEMQVHGINAKGGQHPGENEIILERGLRYRIVADYGEHGSTYSRNRYVDVMVVPNPYAKPE